jgi:hypothetical protein
MRWRVRNSCASAGVVAGGLALERGREDKPRTVPLSEWMHLSRVGNLRGGEPRSRKPTLASSGASSRSSKNHHEDWQRAAAKRISEYHDSGLPQGKAGRWRRTVATGWNRCQADQSPLGRLWIKSSAARSGGRQSGKRPWMAFSTDSWGIQVGNRQPAQKQPTRSTLAISPAPKTRTLGADRVMSIQLGRLRIGRPTALPQASAGG